MYVIDCDTSQHKDDISVDSSRTILKCPLCHGSGTIFCKKKNAQYNTVRSFSTPMQQEEKCNCCDGKGWVTQTQMAKSKFCRIIG